ncbi:MAG: hypothetical protein AAFX06_08970 [Planctomycetota bacterium]
MTGFLIGGTAEEPVVFTERVKGVLESSSPVLVADDDVLDFERYKGYGFPIILRANESADFTASFFFTRAEALRLGNSPSLVTLIADPHSVSPEGVATREQWMKVGLRLNAGSLPPHK